MLFLFIIKSSEKASHRLPLSLTFSSCNQSHELKVALFLFSGCSPPWISSLHLTVSPGHVPHAMALSSPQCQPDDQPVGICGLWRPLYVCLQVSRAIELHRLCLHAQSSYSFLYILSYIHVVKMKTKHDLLPNTRGQYEFLQCVYFRFISVCALF